MNEFRTAVVTKRADVPSNALAPTPIGSSDIVVVALTPVRRIAVRALRTYLMALLGLLGAGAVGAYMPQPVTEFWPALRAAAGMALAPAIVSALWNTLELVQGLDDSHPELRG